MFRFSGCSPNITHQTATPATRVTTAVPNKLASFHIDSPPGPLYSIPARKASDGVLFILASFLLQIAGLLSARDFSPRREDNLGELECGRPSSRLSPSRRVCLEYCSTITVRENFHPTTRFVVADHRRGGNGARIP